VSRRVQPREWADYAADRLDAHRRAQLDELAAADGDAAAARERAMRARAVMSEISGSEAPELSWDSAFARIHWELSLARRQPEVQSRRRWPRWAAAGAGAAALAALALWVTGRPDGDPVATPQLAHSQLDHGSQVIPMQLEAEPLTGLVTLLEGAATRDGQPIGPDQLDRGITVGTTLATTDGRIAVQFGPGSAFELGPQSSVRLLRFDGGEVVLATSGTIDVEVSHRAPKQRFVVHAGANRVEVRGTRFRVEDRDGHLAVSCTRGEVATFVGNREPMAVAAGRRLSLTSGASPAVVEMSREEQDELDESLDVITLDSWDQDWAGSGAHPSGLVAAEAASGTLIAVDGVEVGVAPLWVRVAPGRHHVATETNGTWGPGSWTVVGPSQRVVAKSDAPAAKPRRNRARSRRRARLIRDIEASPAVRGCVRGLEKRGLAEGAYLELEVGLGKSSMHFLNVLRTDLPPAVASCVRRAVGRIELPPGPAVELRHRLQF
jgi:ferric-dicitrate binding protein FerR (iron transport regulator)